jgi:SAM-dependent methyltransferase
MKQLIKRIVPSSLYRPVLTRWRRARPASWQDLRSIEPVSRKFGTDRGTAIDRYYIEKFLDHYRGDIKGCVLEIGDRAYTTRFGGNRVTQSDVLHATSDNPHATIVGDLATGDGVSSVAFDCIILTQTLPFIFDVRQTVCHVLRALKPGGVVLATVPGISQISRYDMDRWGDFWRFTDASVKRLFEDVFGTGNVQIEVYGNVLVACGFLQGLAAHEISTEELHHKDPDYQLLITVRAVKNGNGSQL